ncbi:hypothetical protein ACHAWC_008146 [Mediolabrus comicus]|jgi:hypothetical protein
MQNITESQRIKEGCFVYQIIHNIGLGVRSSTHVGDDNRTLKVYGKNDLVSVDLVLPSYAKDSANGPFLRLSDKSGWLFEKKYGVIVAKQLPVEKGLWAFYVENRMTLKANPTGLYDTYYSTVYEPMQLIYCDRKVISPVTKIASYRVQGTDGWVKEKGDDGELYLRSENDIKTGLFAYEVAEGSSPISVYSKPYVGDTIRLPVVFNVGEIVTCDVIRQSPHNYGNGPFLRLNDGWGWVYERMNDPAHGRMRQLTIEEGNWTLVVEQSAGIAMRRHPVDRFDKGDCLCEPYVIFQQGEIVRCDRRIKSSGGVTFYKPVGKEGWVFDLRLNTQTTAHMMMRLVSSSPVVRSNSALSDGGWSIEFVRGMAAAFELTEITLNEVSKVISFQTDANERINVYYTTRTVGTALNHPNQGATQLFRRRCSSEELREIMQNPRVHTGKGYKKRPRIEADRHAYGHPTHSEAAEYIDEELDYRNKLLEYEKQEEKINQKKLTILKKLKVFDDKREETARIMKSKKEQRENEFEAERQRKEAEAQRIALEAARVIAAEEERRRCTCNVCNQVFVNVHAKNQHYQAVHVYKCNHCYKEFSSSHAMNQHKNATGHW